MMTLTDVGEELEPEDEFLELIDVEEDDLTQEDNVPEMVAETAYEEIEDDIIQFDGPGVNGEDTELEDFINDSLGEEIRIDDDFEDDLTSALGVEAGSDINMADPASGSEEFDFDMDSSEISEKIEQLESIFFDESETEDDLDEDAETEAAAIESAISDTGEEIDEISFDEPEAEDELDEDAESEAEMIEMAVSDTGEETDEISEKIDRLETTFFDESEAEAEFDEDAESEAEAFEAPVYETGEETDEGDIEMTDVEPSREPLADSAPAALAGASPEQIEKSIERIIQQNFSGKIESMVTETIEKAVSKEIDRLKNILLDDGSDDNV
jgi:hypothetical protein